MDAKLAAIIVHDIKNALGALEDELRQMVDAPERARAEHAHESCLSLQEKLVGFLTLYKASSQGLVAHIDALSPADFLAALLGDLRLNTRDIRVDIDAHAMPLIAFFDENLVGLALEAALQNALRFARTRIVIGCVQREAYLSFTIHDDGDGLGTQESIPSTGLGMDLCNAIAQAHYKGPLKGAALLRNHADGGALFELRLP